MKCADCGKPLTTAPHKTAPSNTRQDIEAQNQANAAAAARAEMLEKQRKQD